MKLNLFLILGIICLSSCGDYATLELIDENKKLADSLFRVNRDSLYKTFDTDCDSIYPMIFNRAVDSIKIIQLEKIKELIID